MGDKPKLQLIPGVPSEYEPTGQPSSRMSKPVVLMVGKARRYADLLRLAGYEVVEEPVAGPYRGHELGEVTVDECPDQLPDEPRE